ncbi:hypothetical protein CTAYLR_004214 [Chrysophaeum taylorii]|uniref:G8 domain-containing protein n=1 Tax=Chrysophaeum taylorii TaxID=2483200 RepID=A0AAD7XL60_9STRA|nr:hypothetical protein CTAYLR_004214 [Chrysophaeum taylorii]
MRALVFVGVVAAAHNRSALRGGGVAARSVACDGGSLAAAFREYSLVVWDDAVIKGNADKPVAVRGELSTVEDWNRLTVAGTSYVGTLHATKNKITFSEGVLETAGGFPFDWIEVEALALAIRPSTNVHIVEQQAGQVFDNFDFLEPSDDRSKSNQNNGRTLVVFTGTEDVTISPVWGRCFGPSIIAPFARVVAKGWCSVEGYIVAKSYDANGISQNLYGEGYGQELACQYETTLAPTPSTHSPTTSMPTVLPSTPAPSVVPAAVPTSSPTVSPTGCDMFDALVAHLPLDDASGEDTVSSDTCKVVGATPAANRLGETGGALYFEDSGYVECPEHMALDGNASRSYCAWARAGVSNRKWNGLLRTGAKGECTMFDIRYRPELGRLRIDGSRGSGSTPTCNSILRSVSVPEPYDWHFFCVTYDGAVAVVYVDGAFFARFEGVALDTSTQNPLVIGKRWTGAISDVTVFSMDLTETHVAQLYGGRCDAPPPPSPCPTAVPAPLPLPSPTVSPSTMSPTTSRPTVAATPEPTDAPIGDPTTAPAPAPTTSLPTTAPAPAPTTSLPTTAPAPAPTTSLPTTAEPTTARCFSATKLLAPQDPIEDPSIKNPRVQRVITRATNSELVDLGHPGPARATEPRSNCPHDAVDLTSWDDVVAQTGGDVVLPANTKVLISSCSTISGVAFGTITIPESSELVFADEPLSLEAEGIRVRGALRAGSETCRLLAEITITLRGARPATIYDEQSAWVKGIDVDGGTLDVHGAEYYQTWSRLAVTAAAGDSTLLLQDAVNWDSGMRVVVTSTALKDSRDWHQNEEAIVASVAAATHLGFSITAVRLESPLSFPHYAGDEYQAEVGLLSRRIRIQGDESSEPSDASPLGCTDGNYASYPCENHLLGYGGHVIVQNGAVARVSGTEFYRMGQTNFEGRYPIHWHLVNSLGSYVQDSSFYRSFYKCVTLHGTNDVRVSRNVAYDVIGHCLYLEDGVEQNNVIEFNLHAHVHPIGKPPGEGSSSQNLGDIYDSDSLSTAADATASGFYVSNAQNYVRGNAAVGGFAGYQFPIFPEPIGLHRDSPITPRSSHSLEFDGNSCRSSGFWWGHGGCLYMGGIFEHLEPTERLPMRYNPGRTINGLRSCQLNADDWCPRWTRAECDGEYPTACFAYLQVTNFKASLTTSGAMHWGNRARFENVEVHDFVGGPAMELFGDNSVDKWLVTCHTPNFPNAPQHCGDDAVPHAGDQSDYDCKFHDKRAWESRTAVITWYDTGMNTVVTNTTVRSCNPSAWDRCVYGCEDSAVFELTAHSDQFLPEYMSLTAAFRFEDDDNVNDHLIDFNRRDPPSISGRFGAWLDVDGSACLRPDWGPTIIGSNYDAGDWWKLEDDCELASRDDLMWCCPANGRWLASFSMEWDDSLLADLKGNGGNLCDNSFGGASECPRVGYLAKFGDADVATNGVQLMQRAEVVGAVTGATTSTLGGWYLWFEQGAPVELELNRIQVHRDGRLVLASTYPKGTTFTVTMDAVDWCPSSSYLCAETYELAISLEDLFQVTGSKSYFIDDSKPDATTLFVRIVQRHDRRLSETKTWIHDMDPGMFSNAYVDDLTDRDWGIPYRFQYPIITIRANCATNDGVYCTGGQQPQHIPPALSR